MPIVSSKTIKEGDRNVLCTILAQMAEAELTNSTKSRLAIEFSDFVKGSRSFNEIASKYSLIVKEEVEDDGLWIKIYIPTSFLVGKNIDPANKDETGTYVRFLVTTQTTKPGEKMEGIPVLSKEAAENMYADIVDETAKKAKEAGLLKD